jgi:undecaprenyl-phosphate 4-deoxy-4-formamido-L-arabinose transferase
MALSIVIPVFRSGRILFDLYDRIAATISQIGIKNYEILFVEDGGGDDSWEVVQRIAEKDRRVRGISLSRNYGQHNALLCGIRAARYDVIVTMDDDLQNPPEEIPKLLDKLSEGHDVVYGAPEREQHGFLRNMASSITKYALQGAMGAETARKVSAFRAFRTDIRKAFENYHSPFVCIDVLLTWGTTNFVSVKVKHHPRQSGVSGYTLRKLINHAVNMITGFSTLPLQVASIIGFIFALFGVVLLGYVIGRYLISGVSVPGFTFLASIIAIFSGVQLFALGIIGEYLARMYLRTMDRPPYVIHSQTDGTKSFKEVKDGDPD